MSPAKVKMADWGPALLPSSPPTACALCPLPPDVLGRGLAPAQQHNAPLPAPQPRRQNGPNHPIWPPKSAQSAHASPAAIGAPTRVLPWKPDGMQVPCRVPWPMQVLTLKHPKPHSSTAAHCCAPVMGQPHRFWGGRGHILTRACLCCLSSIAVHMCSS